MAYTGVVRPKLLYACLAWGNAINTIQQLKQLKALDRLAVRSTTIITRNTLRVQRLINLEIPGLVRSLKSSNIELG